MEDKQIFQVIKPSLRDQTPDSVQPIMLRKHRKVIIKKLKPELRPEDPSVQADDDS